MLSGMACSQSPVPWGWFFLLHTRFSDTKSRVQHTRQAAVTSGWLGIILIDIGSLQDAYPTRNKAVNYYNTPTLFNALFEVFKYFMKEKIKKRVGWFEFWQTRHCNFLIRLEHKRGTPPSPSSFLRFWQFQRDNKNEMKTCKIFSFIFTKTAWIRYMKKFQRGCSRLSWEEQQDPKRTWRVSANCSVCFWNGKRGLLLWCASHWGQKPSPRFTWRKRQNVASVWQHQTSLLWILCRI